MFYKEFQYNAAHYQVLQIPNTSTRMTMVHKNVSCHSKGKHSCHSCSLRGEQNEYLWFRHLFFIEYVYEGFIIVELYLTSEKI